MTSAQPLALVTGADGFVGRFVTAALLQAGWQVRRAMRSASSDQPDVFAGLDLAPSTNWSAALAGVHAVVHTAARAHLPARVQNREEELYMSVNVHGTTHLAQSAADAGVQDFIFLSSIAVNGSTTDGRSPFSERDPPCPTTIYGRSKGAAEQGLAAISASTGMRIVAIRPPMIHGRGARGNFQRLSAAVNAGISLPFGLVRNRRAFLGVDNLTSFVIDRLKTPSASGFDIFVLADSEHVSTPDFVRTLARANGRTARIVPFPPSLLRLGLNRQLSDALLGSLELDTSKALATGWRPQLSLIDGLLAAAQPAGAAPLGRPVDSTAKSPIDI